MTFNGEQNIESKYSYTILLNKLNSIYDNRIQYHDKQIQMHNEQIINIQQEKDFYKTLLHTLLHKEHNIVGQDSQESQENYENTEDQNDIAYDNNLDYQTNDFGLDEQDLIWDRIRMASLKSTESVETPIEAPVKTQEKPSSTENKHLDMKDAEGDIPLFPIINSMSKFNKKEKEDIIKKIFYDAKKNIQALTKLDNKYIDNFDEEVSKEADRLLENYLKK